ncbi:MAG: hypothetical protein M1834_004822 [Cirrosporium novae-zelandiae]|nr:MAG: hypothetical protein M1834_004822 [Cirrosporium novae-zelandiae]
MKSSTVLAFFLPVLALSVPLNKYGGHNDGSNRCLTDDQVTTIQTNWRSLLINIDSATANSTLTPDFQLYSDSDNFIKGKAVVPAGTVTDASRAAFVARQSLSQSILHSRVAGITLTPLQILHDCSQIAIRWRWQGTWNVNNATGFDAKIGDPVGFTGIDVLELENGTNLIKTAYTELNAPEFFWDAGVKICFQRNNASACS